MITHEEYKSKSELTAISKAVQFIKERVSTIKRKVTGPDRQQPSLLFQARVHYQSRRNRNKLFATSNLFGDPAWDILLVLFIAAEEDRPMNLKNLCLAVSLSDATALRWVSILKTNGLVNLSIDPAHGGKTIISITSSAKKSMELYFG